MDNAELQSEFPGWEMIEDTGAGDGLPTECERCGKSGTPPPAVRAHGRDNLPSVRVRTRHWAAGRR